MQINAILIIIENTDQPMVVTVYILTSMHVNGPKVCK